MTTVFATPDRLCYITEQTKDGDHHRRWEMTARYPFYHTEWRAC